MDNWRNWKLYKYFIRAESRLPSSSALGGWRSCTRMGWSVDKTLQRWKGASKDDSTGRAAWRFVVIHSVSNQGNLLRPLGKLPIGARWCVAEQQRSVRNSCVVLPPSKLMMRMSYDVRDRFYLCGFWIFLQRCKQNANQCCRVCVIGYTQLNAYDRSHTTPVGVGGKFFQTAMNLLRSWGGWGLDFPRFFVR